MYFCCETKVTESINHKSCDDGKNVSATCQNISSLDKDKGVESLRENSFQKLKGFVNYQFESLLSFSRNPFYDNNN